MTGQFGEAEYLVTTLKKTFFFFVTDVKLKNHFVAELLKLSGKLDHLINISNICYEKIWLTKKRM
jgi:hypothetical protein